MAQFKQDQKMCVLLCTTIYTCFFSQIRVKGLDFNSLYRYSEQLLINFSSATHLVGIVFYSLVCIVPAATYPNISEECALPFQNIITLCTLRLLFLLIVDCRNTFYDNPKQIIKCSFSEASAWFSPLHHCVLGLFSH